MLVARTASDRCGDITFKTPKVPLLAPSSHNGAIGVIFVVDANDRDRIAEARKELQSMLEEDELRDAVLLVVANKQDLPNAMRAGELTEALGLPRLTNRKWYVQAATATTGDGLVEGLLWLRDTLQKVLTSSRPL